jgi:hypothetical protein
MLEGKKTYLIAFIGAAIALAQAFGVEIPDTALQVLGFLGLYTLRAGVAKA